MSQQQLNLYPLPYTASHPPQELVCPVRAVSGRSDMAAFEIGFKAGLKKRDRFLGKPKCVICGEPDGLRCCHIIGHSDIATWTLLKQFGWVPTGVKASPEREPRNGLILCASHCKAFYSLRFFIHYQPTTKRYIFIHYDSFDQSPYLKQFHGKAIALDIKDMHAPLPLLFLVHEYTVRGMNFYQPTLEMQVTSGWQGWLVDEGVVNETDDGSFTFNREAPTRPPAGMAPTTTQVVSTPGSSFVILPPTADLVEELMACQRAMPGWKI